MNMRHYTETQLLIMNDESYYNELMNIVENYIYMEIGLKDAPQALIDALGIMPVYGVWHYDAIEDLIKDQYQDKLQYS